MSAEARFRNSAGALVPRAIGFVCPRLAAIAHEPRPRPVQKVISGAVDRDERSRQTVGFTAMDTDHVRVVVPEISG